MKIEELKPASGSNKKPKRVGRGVGSGHGKTSCKGHKGQKSRSGGGTGPGFEGGQMPLQRTSPKRGFTHTFRRDFAVINLRDIVRLGLEDVTPEALMEKGIVKSLKSGLKVLGTGELDRAVRVKAHAFSASAVEKIKKAGGTAEVI